MNIFSKPWLGGRFGHIANFNAPDEGGGDNGGGGGTGDGGDSLYEAKNYLTDASTLDHPIFEGATTVDDLARIAVEQNAKIGMGNLQMPGEGATTEEMDAFYKQLGRPDESKDYSFGAPTKDDKGNDIPPVFETEVVDGFKQAFHRSGLNGQQADKLYSEIEGLQKSQNELSNQQIADMHAKTEDMLKQKYGASLPVKMQQMQNAVRLVAGEGAADIEDLLQDRRFGSDPRIMSFLMNLGEKLSEPGLRSGSPTSNPNNMTPAHAREEANRIIADEKSPYWDAANPQHQAVRDKVLNLFRIASGE